MSTVASSSRRDLGLNSGGTSPETSGEDGSDVSDGLRILTTRDDEYNRVCDENRKLAVANLELQSTVEELRGLLGEREQTTATDVETESDVVQTC